MDPDLVGSFPPPQVAFGKSFDGFAPLGPCIVSTEVSDLKDAHPSPHDPDLISQPPLTGYP